MKIRLLLSFLLIYVFNAYSIPTYYISSSQGSDSNDGLSEATPYKSISKAPKNKVQIKLKSGDVFYESIFDLKGCIVTSYGSGEKPLICGFKNVKSGLETKVWELVDTDIWRIDLSKWDNFNGFRKEGDIVNDIGVMYCPDKDLVYGHLVNDKAKLKKDGDFFLTKEWKRSNMTPETFKYLYLKHHGNPGLYGKWSFSCRAFGVYNLSNCKVSNLKIQGFAGHGIWGITNTKVESCNLDLIGGSIQLDTYEWVRYGNGVEFYMDRDMKNCEIRKCYFSRIFDCGSTIQLNKSSKNKFVPVAIKFIDNIYVNCRQAFEHFLPPEVPYEKCEFSNNIIFENGDNGFNSPEKRDAAFLSYESRDREDLIIADNQIFGSSFYCGKHYSTNMKGNKVYIYQDQYLTSYHFDPSFPAILANEDEESIKKYKKVSHDDNTEFVILERNSFMAAIYRFWFSMKLNQD